jgi:Ca-activated chloride channel homolog
MMRTLVATVAVVISACVLLSAQLSSALKVRIVAPTADAVLSGAVVFKAEVEPPGADITDVAFYVDGKLVCQVAAAPYRCVWDAGAEIRAHIIRVVARTRAGKRGVNSVRTSDLGYVDRVDVDAVQLAVVVTDSDGRFVRNLSRNAFRVVEDDVPQTLSSFISENVPLELVAALDVSQSMTAAIPELKLAARSFLSALSQTDTVTLVAFNDNIFTLARRSTSTEARLRAVDRLAPWGGTALYDAIIKSVDTLGRQAGRRALVVFSDGKDESSHATLEAATTRVEATDAAVYPVGLGNAMHNEMLRTLLQQLADISGGRSLFRDRPEQLQEAFGEILSDLSNQYLLGYQPTNGKRDSGWRRVSVSVSGGNYHVRHRQGYRLVPPAP